MNQSFDNEELQRYLTEIDSLLPSEMVVELVIVGGAALLANWSDRRTTDVDVISGYIPLELREAATSIARKHRLRFDWFNDTTKGLVYRWPDKVELFYDGQHLKIYAAEPKYLFATKLFQGEQET